MHRHAQRSVSFLSIIRRFWIFFVFAFCFPILSLATQDQAQFSLLSRANESPLTRVWIEPSIIVAQKDIPITVNVLAEVEKPNAIIASLDVPFQTDPSINIQPQQLLRSTPFGGKTIIGTVQLTPSEVGEFTISMPIAQTSIITGDAKLIVQ